ncbi:MAG TPA: hypothetical protein VIJ40_03995 [Acidimicrobiales bacterium]
MLILKIVAILVVLLLAVGVALRVRKLRRDDTRDFSRTTDRRLVTPPPSPYTPSKGFRLLDGEGEPIQRPAVERPRLDPDRHYVFSDSGPSAEDVVATHSRHNDTWFLSRSSHRSTLSIFLRRLAIVLFIALVIAVIATYYVNHHSPKIPKGSATYSGTSLAITAAATTSSTTTTFPSSLVATSTSGNDAFYSVPSSIYAVVVSGTRGATWAVYNMGPKNTLEWQGAVAQGQQKSLQMTGNSRITIGSPSNATVSVEGSPVVFPSNLPPTLVLVFAAASSSVASSTGSG